jgi:hypothetical protein
MPSSSEIADRQPHPISRWWTKDACSRQKCSAATGAVKGACRVKELQSAPTANHGVLRSVSLSVVFPPNRSGPPRAGRHFKSPILAHRLRCAIKGNVSCSRPMSVGWCAATAEESRAKAPSKQFDEPLEPRTTPHGRLAREHRPQRQHAVLANAGSHAFRTHSTNASSAGARPPPGIVERAAGRSAPKNSHRIVSRVGTLRQIEAGFCLFSVSATSASKIGFRTDLRTTAIRSGCTSPPRGQASNAFP